MPDLGDAPPGSAHERALAALWESAPGWRGWLGTVDHKRIGLRYIVTAFAFLLLGGVEALVMRIQLARPNATLLTPAQYDALFTMHGVTMIFLYALPVLSGFANYLWPLMLGSRDMAFPRLNAFSYWAFLFAGLFLYASFPLGAVPDGGWFNYVPLTSLDYSAGAVAYEAVAVSTVATMLIGFEVWVHHMFATGIAPRSRSSARRAC